MSGKTRSVIGACPLDCPDTCSWIVDVRAGKALTLRGNPDHPFTRGALCNKVADYVQYAQSPARIVHPLRRVGRKGAGAFVRITWHEALETIARELRQAISQHGGESIWPYLGTGNMGLIQGAYSAGRRFWNVLGASRHTQNVCTIAGGHGTGYTLGDNRVGMDPETLRYSKLIILWGANVLSTHPHLWRSVLEARKGGACVVAIDPIRTRTAAASDCHLAPVPGTDGALALGLLNVVLAEGQQDEDFICRNTVGWSEFRSRIREYPLDRVAQITGLAVDAIKALGKRLAHSRPTGIRIGIGLQRHGGGGMAVRTITCIPGVTGDWQYPGGGVHYDTRGFFGLNWEGLWRDDLAKRPVRTLQMTDLAEGLLDLANPPIKVLFVYGSNPAVSIPDQRMVFKGLRRTDLFTVVVEHFHTDTTRFADLILPATMAIEHADLLIAYGHLYIAWNEPAVFPPGDCLAATEIFRRLAEAMKLEEPALYDSDETLAREVLDSAHPSVDGITLEALKARGWMRLNYPDPFVPFADGFPSPSGRLEFVSERMASQELDPLAGYTPSYELGRQDTAIAKAYPLLLITPANHYFLNSTFANVNRQRERAGPPTLLIHPDDARVRKIASGQDVRISNRRGTFVAMAEVTDRVRRGTVASTKGYWPQHSKNGATVNATVHTRYADMGKGATYHDNRVQVKR